MLEKYIFFVTLNKEQRSEQRGLFSTKHAVEHTEDQSAHPLLSAKLYRNEFNEYVFAILISYHQRLGLLPMVTSLQPDEYGYDRSSLNKMLKREGCQRERDE